MKIINSREAFMALNPALLACFVSQVGQIIELYQHPSGDESYSIIGVIGDKVFNTGQLETDDMLRCADYTPVLLADGRVKSYFEIDPDYHPEHAVLFDNLPYAVGDEETINALIEYADDPDSCIEVTFKLNHESAENDDQIFWYGSLRDVVANRKDRNPDGWQIIEFLY